MSTTVTYKGNTLTTVDNETKILETKGTWLEDDITIVDESSGGSTQVAFTVMLTYTNGEWVSDKTFAQIQAAYNKGDTVVVSAWEDEYNPCETSCTYDEEFEEFYYTVVWIDSNNNRTVREDYMMSQEEFLRTLLDYLETPKTLVSKNITSNGTYNPWTTDQADGYSQVTVNVPASVPTLQNKTKSYTPTETAQSETITADSGYDGLGQVSVSVGAISSTYVGSGITRRTSSDLTASGATVTAPAGYYAAAATKSVALGTAGTPTAAKGTVSNHAVTVTPSVTNTTGYITGGTKTGTAVTVSASELVSGTLSITQNGTTNVTNYASVNVAIPIVTYYTGTSAPASSLGINGDIYLQTQ